MGNYQHKISLEQFCDLLSKKDDLFQFKTNFASQICFAKSGNRLPIWTKNLFSEKGNNW